MPAKKAAKRAVKKSAKKAAPKKAAAKKAASKKAPSAPKLGRPGTAGKGEGDAAVRAWIGTVKPQHRAIVQRLDKIVGETVPGVKRAIKWSTPMYGVSGHGWIAAVASFKNYVSMNFFAGTDLTPPPPFGEGKGMRRINLADKAELDANEKQIRLWLQQASTIKGWGKVS